MNAVGLQMLKKQEGDLEYPCLGGGNCVTLSILSTVFELTDVSCAVRFVSQEYSYHDQQKLNAALVAIRLEWIIFDEVEIPHATTKRKP